MRPLTGLAIIAATTLVLGILAFAGYYWVLGGPERHADGDGALASLGHTGNVISQGFPRSHGPDWTIGISLCLWQGSEPAVLDGTVSPITTVGDRLRFLGAYARTSDPRPGVINYGGGSLEGFPPSIPGSLYPARGFAVTQPCDFSKPVPQTELLFGVAYDGGTNGNGGGWFGLDIGYQTRGHHHVLATTAWNEFVCGPSVPAPYCGPT